MTDTPTTYGGAEYINGAAYLVELECSCLCFFTGNIAPKIGDDIQHVNSYKRICSRDVDDLGKVYIVRVFRVLPTTLGFYRNGNVNDPRYEKMIALRESGMVLREIGEKFNVSEGTVYRVIGRAGRIRAEVRFWKRVNKDGAGGCWLWKGSIFNNGYGQFKANGKGGPAHRYAYELLVGPIPDEMVLDHLCRVRACVNPDHLEVVTERENIMRGEGVCAVNAHKTHCIRGHEFTPENTRIWGGGRWRLCIECDRMKQRKYYTESKKEKENVA